MQGEAEAGFFRKFVKNSTSNTAIPRILEEEKQASLRDFALAKSWQSIPHKPSPHTLESKRHKLHASTYSLHTILESIFDKTQMDCHAIATALARNDRKNAASKKVDSRSEAQNLKTLAKDSRIFTQNAEILNNSQTQLNLDSSKSQSDSKILDEKCGLQGKSQGSYLDGNDRRDFSPLPHFSLKAESLQAQKPTPKPSQRLAL